MAERRYRGVVTRDGLSWLGRIIIDGRIVSLGGHLRQRDAALAYDRVARFLGFARERWNFPELELEPASVEEVRADARRVALARSEEQRKTQQVSWKIKPRGDTGYWGVAPLPDGRFRGSLYVDNVLTSVGRWPTARAAAIARDRAVLHLGLGWPLNEPRAAREAGPLAPLALRTLAPRVRGGSPAQPDGSVGISYDRRGDRWSAHLKLGGVQHFLGRYERFDDGRRRAIVQRRRSLGAMPSRATAASSPNPPRRPRSEGRRASS